MQVYASVKYSGKLRYAQHVEYTDGNNMEMHIFRSVNSSKQATGVKGTHEIVST